MCEQNEQWITIEIRVKKADINICYNFKETFDLIMANGDEYYLRKGNHSEHLEQLYKVARPAPVY